MGSDHDGVAHPGGSFFCRRGAPRRWAWPASGISSGLIVGKREPRRRPRNRDLPQLATAPQNTVAGSRLARCPAVRRTRWCLTVVPGALEVRASARRRGQRRRPTWSPVTVVARVDGEPLHLSGEGGTRLRWRVARYGLRLCRIRLALHAAQDEGTGCRSRSRSGAGRSWPIQPV